jgi:hypothetical protein
MHCATAELKSMRSEARALKVGDRTPSRTAMQIKADCSKRWI